jgi:hypothetical protein
VALDFPAGVTTNRVRWTAVNDSLRSCGASGRGSGRWALNDSNLILISPGLEGSAEHLELNCKCWKEKRLFGFWRMNDEATWNIKENEKFLPQDQNVHKRKIWACWHEYQRQQCGKLSKRFYLKLLLTKNLNLEKHLGSSKHGLDEELSERSHGYILQLHFWNKVLNNNEVETFNTTRDLKWLVWS